MAEEAKWYVVHTYSGYENKVAQNIEKVVENRKLHDLIPEIRIPMESVTELKPVKAKKKADSDKEGQENTPATVEVKVEKKLFPSYVLVKMILTDDSWYIVRNTRGVTGFVGPGSKPVPLSDKEVAALGVDSGESVVEVNIKEGDSVQVVGGSFDGFTGTANNIDIDNKTVDVTVSMFGRETTVTLPITQVKKEDQ